MSASEHKSIGGLKRVILPILFIVVLIAVQPYLWSFVQSRAELLHQRQAATEQLANLEDALDNIRSNNAQQLVIDDQLDLVLIDFDQVTQAVERVEKAADDTGVRVAIQSINQGAGQQTDDPLSSFTLSLLATGSAEQLLSYLDRIEHLPEVTVINQLSLQENTKGELAAQYIMTTNVLFFADAGLSDAAQGRGQRSVSELEFVSNPNRDQGGGTLWLGILVSILSAGVLGIVLRVRYLRKA